MTIQEAINQTDSMHAASKLLGMPFSTFKRKAGDLYKPNQGRKGIKTGKSPFNKIPLNEIIEGKHSYYKTGHLKHRLIEAKIFEDRCFECGLSTEWNGKPIVLHLDHINGINNDHRLENLRLLCPNCHSQTSTWCGKNINRPSG